MSSQKGNANRTRPQKYQNSSAFRNNLHDKTRTTRMINDLVVSGVCARCKDIIDWKIKYKKYKPISQPKTCIKCQQKVVKMAYYVMCEPCATQRSCCAKCGEKTDIVVQPPPTTAEASSQHAEFQKELRTLSEKKRRKFLRNLAEGKVTMDDLTSGKLKSSAADEKEEEIKGEEDTDSETEDEEDNPSTTDAVPEATNAVPSIEAQPDQNELTKDDIAIGGDEPFAHQ